MGIDLASTVRFGPGNLQLCVLDEKGAAIVREFLAANPRAAIPRDLASPVRDLWVRNRMVKTGRVAHRDLLGYRALSQDFGGLGFTPEFIGVGTGSANVTDADAALGGETFRKPITRRLAAESAGDPEAVFQLFIDTTEANGNTIREAGLFSLSAGGVMWARAVYTAIVKTSATAVTMNWRMPIKAG